MTASGSRRGRRGHSPQQSIGGNGGSGTERMGGVGETRREAPQQDDAAGKGGGSGNDGGEQWQRRRQRRPARRRRRRVGPGAGDAPRRVRRQRSAAVPTVPARSRTARGAACALSRWGGYNIQTRQPAAKSEVAAAATAGAPSTARGRQGRGKRPGERGVGSEGGGGAAWRPIVRCQQQRRGRDLDGINALTAEVA